MSPSKIVRQPAVAGMFYTAQPEALKREIEGFLKQVKPTPVDGTLMALIAPHAGYVYSGLTAAHAYNLLVGRSFETVVVISPSHREYFSGISIYDGYAYRTPLGELVVDDKLRDEISKNETYIEVSSVGHRAEHAIEVQLPFIQHILGSVKILPIVIGDQRRDYCLRLGQKLGNVLKGKSALVVASSDLSHYHSYNEAESLDKIVRNDIASFDELKLMDRLDHDQCEACGGGPIVAALTAARQLGATRTAILHHCNSGDITGDRDAVVGYLAACAYKPS